MIGNKLSLAIDLEDVKVFFNTYSDIQIICWAWGDRLLHRIKHINADDFIALHICIDNEQTNSEKYFSELPLFTLLNVNS